MKKTSFKFLLIKTPSLLGILLVLSLFIFCSDSQAFNFSKDSGLNLTGQQAGYDLVETTPESIVGQVIKTVLGIMGVAFLALMVYAGITWMIAQGNEQKVEKAKNTITQAIVGLIIVVLAYAIAYFVINYFGSKVVE